MLLRGQRLDQLLAWLLTDAVKDVLANNCARCQYGQIGPESRYGLFQVSRLSALDGSRPLWFARSFVAGKELLGALPRFSIADRVTTY